MQNFGIWAVLSDNFFQLAEYMLPSPQHLNATLSLARQEPNVDIQPAMWFGKIAAEYFHVAFRQNVGGMPFWETPPYLSKISDCSAYIPFLIIVSLLPVLFLVCKAPSVQVANFSLSLLSLHEILVTLK